MDLPDLPASELPPPDEPRKLPILGIASLAGALLAVFSICGFIGFIYFYNAQAPLIQEKISVLGWLFVCLVPIGCLAAIDLGIAALVQKEADKTYAILGLVFGGFLLACLCCLVSLLFALLAGVVSSAGW